MVAATLGAAEPVPVPVRIAMLAILVAVGGLMCWTSWLGWSGRLRRNRFVGLVTAASLRSEGAFRAGNRGSAPWTFAAGVGFAGTGLVLPALPSLDVVLAVIAAVSVAAAVLAAVAYVRGDRAARRHTDRDAAAGDRMSGGR